ncbi:MAG: ferritin family protein [Candidatus Cloacimonetes bacterium]|nr:ferritin family protein [Candidatus Cloacimonadota bacterium]
MEKNEELIKEIKKALKNEEVSKKLYNDASNKINNQEVSDFFSSLAQDEESHVKYLSKYLKYVDKDTDIFDLMFDLKKNYFASKELFDRSFVKNLTKTKDMLIAIQKATEQEKKAIDYYSNCSSLENNPELIEFFDIMKKWEQGHLESILELFEQMDGNEFSYELDDF